ncbi:hypothetical protein LTR74_010464 [Friedmanniomyces endolithicus]|nr:hypothetical protein LTR74_010464 [Friedmanniomyces endolithicus]
MSDKIIFYDLDNKKDTAWNPNTWKTRMVLNFKKIPYETEWVEYPALAPKLKALGVPPNPPSAFADYSCPTIRLRDGTYIMDSIPIAEKLEAMHPEPSLHLDNTLWKQASEICDALIRSAGADFMVSIVDDILGERASKWFAEDRHKRFGMSLYELQEKVGGEKAWPATEEILTKLKALLTTHKEDEGPFMLGSKPCYGDLIAVALLEGCRKMDAKKSERMVNFDGSFEKLLVACKPWLEKAN